MIFLAWLAIELVLFVASALLTPKPKFPDATPEDPSGPRSEEGTVLPVVFGSVKVAANVAYFGTVLAREETEHVKTGIFSSKNVTVGYNYSAIFQAILCHGLVDEILDVVWDNNKSMAALDYGPTEFGEIDTDGDGLPDSYGVVSGGGIMNGKTAPFLPRLRSDVPDIDEGQFFVMQGAEGAFGGYQKGGGLSGGFTIYYGSPTQNVSKVMQYALGATEYQQKYEGVCHVIFGKMISDVVAERFEYGERSVMPALEFILRRCPSNLGLSPEQVNINGGANPAEMIYEVLTNPVWGLAMPPAHIDIASFVSAGITLAAEGFGLNLSLNSSEAGDNIITEILRYVDGQVQQHPVTGLAEFTLNRNDYNVLTLPLLDESNISDCTVNRPSWLASKNEIRVLWTQRQGVFFKQVPTQPIQDIGAQRNFADVNATTVEYPAVMDAVLANSLGVRDLRRTATPLGKARLTVNRDAADFRVGRVFLLGWGDYGISPRVHRVASVDYGTMTDGKIIVDAVEDIFALEQPLYNTPIEAVPLEQRIGSRQQVLVNPVLTQTPSTGTLTLEIGSSTNLIQSIEFRTQSGNRDQSAWHQSEATTGFVASVDKHSYLQSAIEWRVNGFLKDGTLGILASGAVSFDVAQQPMTPMIRFVPGSIRGIWSAIITVDPDTTRIKYATSGSGYPSASIVRRSSTAFVTPGQTTVELFDVITGLGYLSILAYDEPGNESDLAQAQTTPVTLVSHVAGKIRTIVTNGVADLELEIFANDDAWPVQVTLFEGNPDGDPLITVSISAHIIINKLFFPELGARPLPLREVRRWYMRMEDVQGNIYWAYGAADRDPIPVGSVDVADYGPAPIFTVHYDSDTDIIKMTLPYPNATITDNVEGDVDDVWQYQVGGRATDPDGSGPIEVWLDDGETRGPYTVEIFGGGVWRTIWQGNIHGGIGMPTIDISQAHSSTAETLTYTYTGDTLELKIGGGVYSAAPASPLVVSLDSSVHTYTFRATNTAGSVTQAVTIPALPPGTGMFTSTAQSLYSISTDTIKFVWGWTGDPMTFRVLVQLQFEGDSSYGSWFQAGTVAAGDPFEYYFQPGVDLTFGLVPTLHVNFKLQAYDGITFVAESDADERLYGYSL